MPIGSFKPTPTTPIWGLFHYITYASNEGKRTLAFTFLFSFFLGFSAEQATCNRA
jgi:hypothetical protein